MESHQHLLVFSETCRLSTLHSQKNLAGPGGLAPSRSVLETNPSARTSRTCGARGRSRAGSRCLEDSRASVNTSREKLVERDGYAPSPPHCKCGVLLLSLRPQSGHDGGTCTREPQLCRLVPWLLGHVVMEIEPRLRSLGVRRLLSRPSSVTAH